MSSSFIFMIAIASLVLWIAQTRELMKPAKEQNGRKIVILTSAGCLTTVILTISLFQHLTF